MNLKIGDLVRNIGYTHPIWRISSIYVQDNTTLVDFDTKTKEGFKRCESGMVTLDWVMENMEKVILNIYTFVPKERDSIIIEAERVDQALELLKNEDLTVEWVLDGIEGVY